MDVPKLTPEQLASFPPEALALIQALFAKIAELEERLNKHSGNSSKPPSSDSPSVKRAPPKPVSGKKPGGQPGHPKQTRELIPSEKFDVRLDLILARCKKCSSPLAGFDSEPERFQVSELPPIKPLVTEHRLHRLTCRCGCVTQGELPTSVLGQDEPRLKSAVVFLTGRYRLSKKGESELLGDLFGVSMSASQMCEIEAEVGEALQPLLDDLLTAARRLPSNVDETSMGKNRWLWAMVTAVGNGVSDRDESNSRCPEEVDRTGIRTDLNKRPTKSVFAFARRGPSICPNGKISNIADRRAETRGCVRLRQDGRYLQAVA